jgi:hypothetical protein
VPPGVCQSSHKGLVRVLSDRSDQEEQVRGHLVFIFSFNNVPILGPRLVPSRAEIRSRTYDEVTLFELGSPVLGNNRVCPRWLIRRGNLDVR